MLLVVTADDDFLMTLLKLMLLVVLNVNNLIDPRQQFLQGMQL